jgi:hypothetical protein
MPVNAWIGEVGVRREIISYEGMIANLVRYRVYPPILQQAWLKRAAKNANSDAADGMHESHTRASLRSITSS